MFLDKTYRFPSHSTSKLYAIDSDLMTNAVLTSVISDYKLVDVITDMIITSLGVTAKRYYKYAAKTYTYGLPSGYSQYTGKTPKQMEEFLLNTRGIEATVLTCCVGIPNPLTNIKNWLQSNRGLNTDYTVDPLTLPEIIEPDGIITLKAIGDVIGSSVELTYVYRKATKHYNDHGTYDTTYTVHVYTELVPVNTSSSLSYIVEYMPIVDGVLTGTVISWIYPISSGVYPELVAGDNKYPYMPVVPVREKYVDLTDSANYTDNTVYKQTKRMLNQLNISLGDIGDALNDTADIDKVRGTHVVFEANVASDNEYIPAYLYDFFCSLVGVSKYTKFTYGVWFNQSSKYTYAPNYNYIQTEEQDLLSYLSYNYIASTVKTGNVTSVGSVTRIIEAKANRSMSTTTSKNSGDQTNYITTVHWEHNPSVLTLRKQLDDTHYHEIEVVGLEKFNKCNGSNYPIEDVVKSRTTSTKQSYINVKGSYYSKHSLKTATDSDTEDTEAMTVPINPSAINSLKILERHSLLSDCLRLWISVYFTKTVSGWTKLLGLVLTVIAIAVTVYSGGVTASAIAGAATLSAAALIIVTNIVVAVAIQYATGELVKLIGPELAAVIAIAGTVYGLKNPASLLGTGSIFGCPFSVDLMSVTNGIYAGINKYTADATAEYASQAEEWANKNKTLQEELLAEAEEQYNNTIIAGLILADQEPDDYYAVKVHNGNIGVSSLDSIGTFVDSALSLDRQLL